MFLRSRKLRPSGLALCLLLLLVESHVVAATDEGVDRLQLGTCELPSDPLSARESLWFLACAQARYGWEQTFVLGNPDENGRLRYGEGYLGAHLNRFVSLHARGVVRHYLPSTDEGGEALRQERPELAVLQLGNPAFHKLRFLVGRLQLPFGIDESRVMESYRLREDRSFWDSPPFAVQMTYDNLRDAVVDVGVASNVPSKKVAEGKRAERHALSARSAFDFPALDGSRLLFSGYWEDGGETRVGFGFVTVSRRNDLTQFEWIRQQEAGGGGAIYRAENVAQLFRLSFLGHWRNNTRWAFQYDDEWSIRRSFIFGYDIQFYDHLRLRNGLTFLKEMQPSEDHRYMLSMGLEAHL